MPDIDSSAISTSAWALTFNTRLKLALDESSMAEYIIDPQLYSIPDAVDYCNQVILWRNEFTPVIDLNLILGDPGLGAQHIAVLAYQEYAGQKPQYVAIKLASEVERIAVIDDDSCDWPKDYPLEIQPIVESLFMYQDQLHSVINIADLCNEGYRDYLLKLAEIKAGR